MSAVLEELYSSSPSSLEGLNTTMAFRLLESHGVGISDAIKATVRSELKSPTHTYAMLPPELVPGDKKPGSLRETVQGFARTSIVLCFLVPAFGFDLQRFRWSGVSKHAFRLLLPTLVAGLVRLC